MTETLDVVCRPTDGGHACTVHVGDDAGATTHEVRVEAAVLARIAPGATEADDLVRRSFEFLLAREPRESIMRSFDLPVIERYFPGYEAEIRRADRTPD